jgi:hypothetical protein
MSIWQADDVGALDSACGPEPTRANEGAKSALQTLVVVAIARKRFRRPSLPETRRNTVIVQQEPILLAATATSVLPSRLAASR